MGLFGKRDESEDQAPEQESAAARHRRLQTEVEANLQAAEEKSVEEREALLEQIRAERLANLPTAHREEQPGRRGFPEQLPDGRELKPKSERPSEFSSEPKAPIEETGVPSVVQFKHVTKTFNAGTDREYTAIKDVNFTVSDLGGKGEFISILGPSGCGKSTILRLIAGLTPHHPATTGEVVVQGDAVLGPGADRGMVFQDYTSFDNRTVIDNVAFGLECQGVPTKERHEHAKRWIHRVGLDVDRDSYKYPHQLSGGMRQRVAIARTLILHPRIILMDEPFGALDPATRLSMQDLLVTLWRDLEATIFFVTHSIEEAVYLGDRIHVLSSAPGTLLREMEVPPPDRPAKEMQREAAFMDIVYEIRDLVDTLESSHRAGDD